MLFVFFVVNILSVAGFARADGMPVREKNGLVFTLETIALPDAERMTLLGVNYRIFADDRWYYGPSVYGALLGERGGFFTGGFTAGMRAMLGAEMWFDMGLFAGGGGGGAAPQGGGLMVRPQASLWRSWDEVQLGIGWSQVWYPNGEIDAPAVFLAAGGTFDRVFVPGREQGTVQAAEQLAPARWRYLVAGSAYAPTAASRTTGGVPYEDGLALAGCGFDRSMDGRLWFSTRIFGAVAGDIDGYAKVLAGPVWTFDGPGILNWECALYGGAAGGGGVDTGGGLLFQPEAGVSIDLGREYALLLRAGYVLPRDGNFEGWVTTLGVAWCLDGYRIDAASMAGVDARAVPWRIGAAHKVYSGLSDKELGTGPTEDGSAAITLIGLTVDRFISPRFFLCGKAYAATTGGAGGYAEGLAGAGLVLAGGEDWDIEAELFAGAGGGGGVVVGSGGMAGGTLGAEYRWSREWSAAIRAGWIDAPGGSLACAVWEAGLCRSFGQLVERN
ncbi:MAG: hypothetical protein ABIF71_15840 [Planctomycetota bacterium]